MNNITFLTEEQVFGENKLNIINKYGTNASITDFAILLGGIVYQNGSKKMNTGLWYTKTPWNKHACAAYNSPRPLMYDVIMRRCGARPVLNYELIKDETTCTINNLGVKEIEFGEYPQTVVSDEEKELLENAYNNNDLIVTGKEYTLDSKKEVYPIEDFSPRIFKEFEYDGNKFIRFIYDNTYSEDILLSNGKIVKKDDICWIKVEPITWLIDEENDIALAKKILFSGIQFHNERYYNGNFEATNINEYMNNYFIKEIQDKNINNNLNVKDVLVRTRKKAN